MPRSINRVVLLCGLLVLAAIAGGCQRGPAWDLTAVEGTVTKDGRPLRGVQVVFLPDTDAVGPRSTGLTDEAGHYRLRTGNGDDGAVVGKHRILIFDLEAAKGRRRPAHGPQLPEFAKRLEEQGKTAGDAPRVPPRYGRFNETPLRVDVQPGAQVIDLEVK